MSPAEGWDPAKPFERRARTLKVRPVLLYATPMPKKQTSWKSWGGVQTEAAANEELARIQGEWAALKKRVDFPVEVLPAAKAVSVDAVTAIPREEGELRVVYPATGSGQMLRAALGEGRDGLIFVRHRSGPVYYWYEALSTQYLRKTGVAYGTPGAPRVSVDDVVVDDLGELEWRLRAWCGARTFVGTKVLALGGTWGKYAAEAPEVARKRFGFEIVETDYEDFARRMASALKDAGRMKQARGWTEQFVKMPGTKIETEMPYVVNSFIVYGVFKDLMREHGTEAFTVRSCMGTLMPLAETTACLALQFMGDEGIPAFCESDFCSLPACLFLRAVNGRPVFMHNSTFPHQGIVTCAHCATPRRLDGVKYESVRVLTHYESEYGASPKVEMPVGQKVTFINPEYATCRWVGMTGVVQANPFLPICRSQQDVRIDGDWKKLLNEVRDSHWAMTYGDCLKECGYAAERVGVKWEAIT